MSEEVKEIAKELVESFYSLLEETDTCFGICEDEIKKGTCTGTGHGCYLWKEKSRQCALITVNKLITEIDFVNICWSESLMGMQHATSYRIDKWKEVKTEIENYGR